ncbi:unnamed protein product, partial [Didymodactylos carnosus]
YNVYAPAECTIAAIYHSIVFERINVPVIPLGRPLPGRKCCILDEYLQPVPLGSIGEIFIGGIGIFSGYLNNCFIEDRLTYITEKREKYYKSGDLGKFDTNSQLHFCGRVDFQVKLRGQRIEIGEIEQTIMNSSANVSNCIVVKCYNDEQQQEYLVAYVQSTTQTVTEKNIRSYCLSLLPVYMVPSVFILLDKFPQNKNGKLDRKQLPKPDLCILIRENEKNEQDYNEKAKTNFEKQVHNLWCQLLDLKQVSLNSNFFSIGEHIELLDDKYDRPLHMEKWKSFNIEE